MAVVHISEAEVAGDVPGLVARVLAGEEIVIDSTAGAVKMVPVSMPIARTTSEVIAALDARERERGYAVTMDEDFRKDMEEIIANRKPATGQHGTDSRHFNLDRSRAAKAERERSLRAVGCLLSANHCWHLERQCFGVNAWHLPGQDGWTKV